MAVREIREQVNASSAAAGGAVRASSRRRRSRPPRSARCIAPCCRRGEDVVVKVQYPGVEETVGQDLKNMQGAAADLHPHRPRRDAPEDRRRARSTRSSRSACARSSTTSTRPRTSTRFRQLFADDREVMIPERYPEFSSRRVLTMSTSRAIRSQDILEPGRRPGAQGLGGDQVFPRRCGGRSSSSACCTPIRIPATTSSPTIRSSPCSTSAASACSRSRFGARYLDLAARCWPTTPRAMADCFVRLGFLDRRRRSGADDPHHADRASSRC